MARSQIFHVGKLFLQLNNTKCIKPTLKFSVSTPRFNARSVFGSRFYCISHLPYEDQDTSVVYKNGFPVVDVVLPSRDEKCIFTLRPLTDTVGSFLAMVKDEDGGIERISLYRKDGSKIAKSTTIDFLLQDDFDLVINSRKFAVSPPKVELQDKEKRALADVKDLVTQLYTQMHLTEWHASREQQLLQSINSIRHELEPYEQLRADMMEKAEKKTNRLTWFGLTLMGVQFGFLARLTWWEYSWDIMEPVTYFVTYGTSMALFAYYVLTRQEYLLPDAKDRAFLLHLHKLANKSSYDVEHYNQLMVKLSKAQEDLERLQKPLGLSMPESELQSLLHGKQTDH